MDLREDLKSGGAYPTGPVSAWPKERHDKLHADMMVLKDKAIERGNRKVKASPAQMAGGLLRTAGQAIANGRVSAEIREERYDTCKACPAFLPETKRCSECGCFMEAKTWIGGDKNALCPLMKWER